jgi:GntR family transcriptional regulator / MocR family aminotransferase
MSQSRPEPVFELPIELPDRASRRLLQELHGQLRQAIAAGRLQAGMRLPSRRGMAARLGVSRNTVATAYDMLIAEGLIEAQHGAGTFVSREAGTTRPSADPPAAAPDARLRRWPETYRVGAGATWASGAAVNLQFGLGDQRSFPFDTWRRLSSRVLRAFARRPDYAFPPAGVARLRSAIAGHVSFTRAIACETENVIVLSGAQQAFDIIARTLVAPGDIVAVEDPGYPPAHAAFAAAGARIAPVPVDGAGLRVDALPADARIIYVTPSHQFPTGAEMSAERRRALLDHAAAQGAVVVEDDYDGEFRFGDEIHDALQTLDRSGSVVYVGTFSKCLFAGVRVGFVIAPPWLGPALISTKKLGDWSAPGLAQLTLASFIEEGHLARHVRRMRGLYAPRRQALLGALETYGGGWIETIPSTTGLHLSARLTGPVTLDGVADAAVAAGVVIERLDRYALVAGAGEAVGFGYGLHEPEVIVDSVRRIAHGVSGTAAGQSPDDPSQARR